MLAVIDSFGLKQHVTGATDRNGHTLDLVISRSDDMLILSSKATDLGFPDHYPVFTHMSLSKPTLPTKCVTYWKLKNITANELDTAIQSTSICSTTLADRTLDELTTLYDTSLSAVINGLAPLRTRSITIRPEAKWYNEETRAAKQQRRQAERRWRKSGLTVHRDIYIEQKQRVNTIITEAKASYYKEAIQDHKGDTKQLFKFINNLLGKTNGSPLPSEKTNMEVADMFSDFFIEKIFRIQESIPDTPYHTEPPAVNVTSPLSDFHPVSEEEVIKIIKTCANKSCDLDPLPTSVLKQGLKHLGPIITAIINKSLCTGTFPTTYKQALVTPLLKKASLDPDECKNYRPVSNLGFISKVLEKVVAAQLNQHLQENGLQEPLQSAYRQGHSCETALLKVHNDIVRALGEKKVVLLVLLDLSAAFDTVNHHYLLDTLSHLGICDTALQWFSSYLIGRQQRINIKGTLSDSKTLSCGVPQGSVLGPVLFTVYTSTLGQLIRKYLPRYHLYADDTQLYIHARPDQLHTVVKSMEMCIAQVQAWMCGHHLKMNESKTEFLVISSRQAACKIQTPTLNIGGHTIVPTNSARNIGVIMDSQASMEAHVNNICKKAYGQLHNICKIKRYIDRDSLECIIHAFVTTKLDFCNSVLCGIGQSLTVRLQRVQNTAARILTGHRRCDHITPVLFSLHWLPIEQRIKFKILIMVYKSINAMAPVYLQELVKLYQPPRRLRSADHHLLEVPFSRSTKATSQAFSIVGPSLWNKIPLDIRSAWSLTVFKSKLKTYLFTSYYEQSI